MKRSKGPLWTHPLFAGFVALAFLVAARAAMKGAVGYAQFKVDPLKRLQPDNTRATLMLILSMLLVIGAIVVPLVIRKRAQRALGEDSGGKA